MNASQGQACHTGTEDIDSNIQVTLMFHLCTEKVSTSTRGKKSSLQLEDSSFRSDSPLVQRGDKSAASFQSFLTDFILGQRPMGP